MGLRDLLGGKKKTRAQAVTAVKKKRLSREEQRERLADRLKAEKSREELRQLAEQREYMARLREKDPARYDAIMERKLGLADAEPSTRADSLEKFIEMRDRFRDAGLTPEGDEQGGAGMIKAVLQAVPYLAPLLGLGQGPAMAAPQVVYTQAPPQQQTAAAEPPPAAQATPQPAPAATPSVAEQPAQPVPPQPATNLRPPDITPQDPSKWTLASQFLVEQLNNKTAKDAALWLQNERNSIATAFVAILVSTPDEHLGPLVTSMVGNNPALAGFAGWLTGRWPWFVEVVHELRALQTPKKDGTGL